MNPHSRLPESSRMTTVDAAQTLEERVLMGGESSSSLSIQEGDKSTASAGLASPPQKKKKRKKTFLGNLSRRSEPQKQSSQTNSKPLSETSLCPTILTETEDYSADSQSQIFSGDGAPDDAMNKPAVMTPDGETSATPAVPLQKQQEPSHREKFPSTVEEEVDAESCFSESQHNKPHETDDVGQSSSHESLYDDSEDDEYDNHKPAPLQTNKTTISRREGSIAEKADKAVSSKIAQKVTSSLYNDSEEDLLRIENPPAQSSASGDKNKNAVNPVKIMPQPVEEEKQIEEIERFPLDVLTATSPMRKSILKWKDQVDWTNRSEDDSRGGDDRRERLSVSYGQVQIRYHFMDMGDNPTCSIGAPVSLSWNFEQADRVDLDVYELERKPRRKLRHMVLNYYQRQDILRRAGYSDSEIQEVAKDLHKIKQQRNKTQMMLPVSKLEEAWQSAGRKFKRLAAKKDTGRKAGRRLSGSSAASGSSVSSRSSRSSR